MTAEAGAPDGRTACTVDELLIAAPRVRSMNC